MAGLTEMTTDVNRASAIEHDSLGECRLPLIRLSNCAATPGVSL